MKIYSPVIFLVRLLFYYIELVQRKDLILSSVAVITVCVSFLVILGSVVLLEFTILFSSHYSIPKSRHSNSIHQPQLNVQTYNEMFSNVANVFTLSITVSFLLLCCAPDHTRGREDLILGAAR